MSMLIYFTLLLTIIAYQSIKDRKAYKLDQLAKVMMKARQEQEQALRQELNPQKVFQKGAGHYAISHRESLSPTLNQGVKRAKKANSISQS